MYVVPCKWSFVGFRLGTALSPANGPYDQPSSCNLEAKTTWQRPARIVRASSQARAAVQRLGQALMILSGCMGNQGRPD